jgi:hypothetical protein
MIESGISNWALGNAALQPLLGQSDTDKGQKLFTAFYFSFLPKNPTLPAIVLDRLKADEPDDTLDARTAAPGTSIEAHFQFGCVAQDSPENPANASGYLSAALLGQQLRRQLMALATGRYEFPDGTIVQEVRLDDEFDAHFEIGGQGYIFRRMVMVTITFQETT